MEPLYSLEQAIEKTVREEWGRILASLVKTLRDLQLAEDSLQDAIEVALLKWKETGLPHSPSAWLIKTAHRKAIDRVRRAQNFERKQTELTYLKELEHYCSDDEEVGTEFPDKRLELIFTCCHPALEEKTKIALTLRTLGGLTVEEIAYAFLDKPSAMAQRLVRAKRKIKLTAIPYEIPDVAKSPERLSSVLSVVYLIFNEGYSASSGDNLIKVDLFQEAIRLGRILRALLPDETEVAGLLALMLLHFSRSHARLSSEGEMIALEEQNRDLWDKAFISEGITLLKDTLVLGRVGPYQLQAAISALHAEASSWNATDWAQISALYELLYAMQPSPVVKVNHAVAVSYSQNAETGLVMLDELDLVNGLEIYQPFYIAKADLLYRSGSLEEARLMYLRAIELSTHEVEKNFLCSKLAKLDLEYDIEKLSSLNGIVQNDV